MKRRKLLWTLCGEIKQSRAKLPLYDLFCEFSITARSHNNCLVGSITRKSLNNGNLLYHLAECMLNNNKCFFLAQCPQGLEMLMPDVSRVYRTPFYGAQATSDLARSLFLKPRRTHLETTLTQPDMKHLMSTEYEAFLKAQVLGGLVLEPQLVGDCMAGKSGNYAQKMAFNVLLCLLCLHYKQRCSNIVIFRNNLLGHLAKV